MSSIREKDFGISKYSRFAGTGTAADPLIRSVDLVGSGGTSVNVDESTGALVTITQAHHEVHEGDQYLVTDSQNLDTTTMLWQVTAPNTAIEPHIVFDIECTGEMLIVITEGSDMTDGTAMAEVNRNRRSVNTATTIVTRTPTGGTTVGTTVISTARSGATSIASKTIASGAARGTNEFVLKINTKYVISVTTFADVWVSLHLDWYEH